jgi:chemotaxis methyl-accepting protein methylase
MCQLLDAKAYGSSVKMSVLACSKGAEVYSIVWAIRTSRPDLKLSVYALDISQEILEFAERGVYSREEPDALATPDPRNIADKKDVTWNTCRDQNAPIFERMTEHELEAMFDTDGDNIAIKPWLKEGVVWIRGDAGDPEIVNRLGLQDLVVANRFLCHMKPAAAEKCLTNVARLVKPGGYLFVSGIDLDVRTKVAVEMAWKPVMNLMRELHEGDTSLRRGWPLEYWGLEPFRDARTDRKIRYASVFEID